MNFQFGESTDFISGRCVICIALLITVAALFLSCSKEEQISKKEQTLEEYLLEKVEKEDCPYLNEYQCRKKKQETKMAVIAICVDRHIVIEKDCEEYKKVVLEQVKNPMRM